VELQKKIQQSKMLNAARRRVLKAREDHVSTVLEEAKKRLAEATKENTKYSGLLQQLVAQGLLQLLELNVLIRCRQADLQFVEKVIAPAVDHYKERTGKECHIKVDNESFLPPHVGGGIDLLAQRGKIKISNTLDARLDMLARQMIPEVRVNLFGRNMNRRFTD
jgi:V-type H+-transporting ATPase subunit E